METREQYLLNKEFYQKNYGLEYYTKKEEVWNTWSHFFGGVIGIAAMIFLLISADSPAEYAAAVLTGIAASYPYFVSAAYHFIKDFKKKRIARKIDHSSVCFIICACGTPLALGMTIHAYDIVVIAVCYSIALLNIVLVQISLEKYSHLELALDLLACALLVGCYFINRGELPSAAKVCYIVGSVFCICGLACFGRRAQFLHTIFHILMVIGTVAYLHCGFIVFGA